MKLEDAEAYLQDLVETQPLQSVGAHGGEPFLYFELLKTTMKKASVVRIHRRACLVDSNIPNRWSGWAKWKLNSEGERRKFLMFPNHTYIV